MIFSTHLLLSLLLPPDVRVDALSDGELARSLADLRQVSAGEALKNISSYKTSCPYYNVKLS